MIWGHIHPLFQAGPAGPAEHQSPRTEQHQQARSGLGDGGDGQDEGIGIGQEGLNHQEGKPDTRHLHGRAVIRQDSLAPIGDLVGVEIVEIFQVCPGIDQGKRVSLGGGVAVGQCDPDIAFKSPAAFTAENDLVVVGIGKRIQFDIRLSRQRGAVAVEESCCCRLAAVEADNKITGIAHVSPDLPFGIEDAVRIIDEGSHGDAGPGEGYGPFDHPVVFQINGKIAGIGDGGPGRGGNFPALLNGDRIGPVPPIHPDAVPELLLPEECAPPVEPANEPESPPPPEMDWAITPNAPAPEVWIVPVTFTSTAPP